MKVIVIEDEQLSAELLISFIAKYSKQNRKQIQILDTLETVEESVEWLNKNPHPDLIFLDIHLNSTSSFDIFVQIQVLCPVIFTTAYNKYAIKSFQTNSIAYLLKPLNQNDVNKALDKYITLEKFNESKISSLLKITDKVQSKKKYLQVHHGNTYQTIAIDSIAYFYAENKLVYLKTFENKTRVTDKTLEELIKQLNQHDFFQINRQMIIRFNSINEGVLTMKLGKILIQLNPNFSKEVKVSRSRLNSFKFWVSQQ